MKHARFSHWSRLGLACAGLALAAGLATPARAELGGVYDGIERDRQQLNAAVSEEPHATYTVYILACADGTTVREFYSPHSGIFAVSWSGMGRRPDMRQILGSYFDRFQRTPEQMHAAHNQAFHRAEPDFVIESRGEQRHFTGRAFIPQYRPQEVPLAEIR